ncbi:hypothetical protein OHB01_15145 [Microbispora hainanensis]|uniref:PH domain-containing protein n=1 Tax=Microbispora hainanensis TaxID=568844 RepID=A0ABZ1SJA2_9ACTN|nr:hypothetical protein [Microbispora hainanensis]
MALHDSLRSVAAPYLRQGETIQAVFGAQTLSQWLFALTGMFLFFALNQYRIFVVTPQRILVLDAGKVTMTKAKGVLAELPRATKLGPGTGMWHVIRVGDEKLRVHRRFFKDIAIADAQVTA